VSDKILSTCMPVRHCPSTASELPSRMSVTMPLILIFQQKCPMTFIPNINSYRCLITVEWVRINSITNESFDPGRPFILSIVSTFQMYWKKIG